LLLSAIVVAYLGCGASDDGSEKKKTLLRNQDSARPASSAVPEQQVGVSQRSDVPRSASQGEKKELDPEHVVKEASAHADAGRYRQCLELVAQCAELQYRERTLWYKSDIEELIEPIVEFGYKVKGDHSEALEIIKYLEQTNPPYPSTKALILARIGKVSECIEVLEEYRSAPRRRYDPNMGELYLAAGKMLIRAGKQTEAADLFLKSFNCSFEEPLALLLLGIELYGVTRPFEALESFLKAYQVYIDQRREVRQHLLRFPMLCVRSIFGLQGDSSVVSLCSMLDRQLEVPESALGKEYPLVTAEERARRVEELRERFQKIPRKEAPVMKEK
jgi:hypothetical protein